jgi:hypothetical protein
MWPFMSLFPSPLLQRLLNGVLVMLIVKIVYTNFFSYIS